MLAAAWLENICTHYISDLYFYMAGSHMMSRGGLGDLNMMWVT